MTDNTQKWQKYARTTVHERRECPLPPEDPDYFPWVEIDMTIDSSQSTSLDMIEWFESFLVASGHSPKSILEAYQTQIDKHQ